MKIKDIMGDEIAVVSVDDTIEEAAQKMAELSTGVLAVKNDGKVVGVLTDRDIVIRAIAKGKDPRKSKTKEAMTSEVIYSFEDQRVEEATEKMKTNRVRRLLVFNRQRKPVGMVSLVP